MPMKSKYQKWDHNQHGTLYTLWVRLPPPSSPLPSFLSPRQIFNDNTQGYQNRNIVRRSRAKCLTSITNSGYMGPGSQPRLLWWWRPPTGPPTHQHHPLRRIQHGVGCWCFAFCFAFPARWMVWDSPVWFVLVRFVCDINEVYQINKSPPPHLV